MTGAHKDITASSLNNVLIRAAEGAIMAASWSQLLFIVFFLKNKSTDFLWIARGTEILGFKLG